MHTVPKISALKVPEWLNIKTSKGSNLPFVNHHEGIEGGPQEGAEAGIHVIVAVVELAHRPGGGNMQVGYCRCWPG